MPAPPDCATGSTSCNRNMRPDEYRKLAAAEDGMWYFRALHRHFFDELRFAGLTGRPARILDAGCGTGGLLRRLARWEPTWQLHGIDFSAAACAFARERCGEKVEIVEASALALPYEAGSFDAILSADVMCQLRDPATAFREMARVLRPGGVALVNAPAYQWMWSYHDDACESVHRFTRPEVAALYSGAGFVSRKLTHWNALPFPAVWARRKLFPPGPDSSDVQEASPLVERSLDIIMAVERAWWSAGGDWAWGTSIFGSGQKPAPA